MKRNESKSQCAGEAGTILDAVDQQKLDHLLQNSLDSESEGFLEGEQNVRPDKQQQWPVEMQREWVIQLATKDSSKMMPHRMYTCIRSQEIRIGTVIVLEDWSASSWSFFVWHAWARKEQDNFLRLDGLSQLMRRTLTFVFVSGSVCCVSPLLRTWTFVSSNTYMCEDRYSIIVKLNQSFPC